MAILNKTIIALSVLTFAAVLPLVSCTPKQQPAQPKRAEAPQELTSAVPSEAGTEEPSAVPNEEPTAQPVQLKPGVLIENRDNYTFVKDASSGKTLVDFYCYDSSNMSLYLSEAYEFENIKSPESVFEETQGAVMTLYRQDDVNARSEAFPLSRSEDREYLSTLVGEADFSLNKPGELTHSPTCWLIVED